MSSNFLRRKLGLTALWILHAGQRHVLTQAKAGYPLMLALPCPDYPPASRMKAAPYLSNILFSKEGMFWSSGH